MLRVKKARWVINSSILIDLYMGNFISASQGGSVDIVTRLQAGRPRNRSSLPGEGKRFVTSAKISRPKLGTTRLPLQKVQ